MSIVATPLQTQPATSPPTLDQTPDSPRDRSPRDSVPNKARTSTKSNSSSSSTSSAAQSRMLARQSTVPEVTKDSSGYTWEIYGAEIDPESLRQAIEKHNLRLKAKRESMRHHQPNIQRSATLRDSLWEPVRKLFASRTRSATHDATFGTQPLVAESTNEQPAVEATNQDTTGKAENPAVSESSGGENANRCEQAKNERLPTTPECEDED